MRQNVFAAGAEPRFPLGEFSLQRCPDPLAGFREGGREVRMEGGRAKKERMGKERKGKAMQKGDIGFRGIDASGYPTAHQFHWEIYS